MPPPLPRYFPMLWVYLVLVVALVIVFVLHRLRFP